VYGPMGSESWERSDEENQKNQSGKFRAPV
jgi:hypothetical protein